MKLKGIFILVALFTQLLATAQRPGGGGGSKESAFYGEIFGKIISSDKKEAVEYVTLKLFTAVDSQLVTGVITNASGAFSFPNLKPGKYYLEIAFFSFQSQSISDLVISKTQPTVNLKDIELVPESMETLVVKGEEPLVRYEIDKKVINVENQITNAGQSAVEILQNAPSVTVDSEGNVSLRGSGSFTLLINGIPTALDPSDALASIPASTIKDIEIITNPSARYDAEGTSGIINIITKKNKLEGVSLLTNLNYGTFDNYGGDLSLSIGKKKFTFNLGGKFGNRNRPRDIDKTRTTWTDTSTSVIKSFGEGAWAISSYGGNGEIMYEPNASHTLIVGSSIDYRFMRPYFTLDFDEFINDTLVNDYVNKQDNIIDIFTWSSNFFYQYNFNRNKEHHLAFKALINQKDVTQDDYAVFYDQEGNQTGGTRYTEVGPADFVRFDLDYIQPFTNSKLEIGGRVQLGTSADDGRNYNYDSTAHDYIINPLLSSEVDYSRDVYAGYGMFGGRKNAIGYQLGVRGEYTHRTIESTNFGDFTTIKRMDWFPSAHFSFDLKNKDQVLISYSRRIERPRSWYFEPFITYETAYNVRTGNPDLTPEYINNMEISWIRPLKEKKGYMTVEAYFRLVNGQIERVSTVYEPSILITRPYNIGVSQSIGLEPSINYDLKEWWKINLALNLFYFNVNGSLEDQVFDNSSFNYNGSLTNSFKLKGGWMLQMVTRYQSASATAQGTKKDAFVMDASVRKNFSEGKCSLSLAGRNILGTDRDHFTIEGQDLLLLRYNTPKYPMVTMAFSMKLNNYKKILSKHEGADDF